MKKTLLTLLVVCLISSPVYAIDFLLTGTEVTATYTEPTTNVDGSPLMDLSKTTIYYDLSGIITIIDVPATRLTGGGVINQIVTIPIIQGQERDVWFWATASDLTGNESAESVRVMKRIDRLAPSVPQ